MPVLHPSRQNACRPAWFGETVPPRALLLLAALAGFVGCSDDLPAAAPGSSIKDIGFSSAGFDISGGLDVKGIADTKDPDGNSTDGQVSDLGQSTDYTKPCIDNTDCESGYCIQGPDGKICTKTCVETCDEGWTCSQVAAGSDTAYICKPAFMHLCDPCNEAAQCDDGESFDNLCAPQGPLGSFCGTACNPTKPNCPAGYECSATTNPDSGKAAYQCMTVSGVCACSAMASAQKRSTTCMYKNVFGKCIGTRSCGADGLSECDAPVPGQEECNGLDDDCNGETDEGVEGAKCFFTNVFGSCPGKALACAEGKPTCDAPEPKPETCNGLDDDCSGAADDGICDDGNPCTKDTCSGEDCKHDQGAAGLMCDDGNACTQEDGCAAGTCVGGNVKSCDDGSPCTTDSCDPLKGCKHASAAPGTTCDADVNPCTADACDGNGSCKHPPLEAGKQCPDDGDPCTGDTCDGGGTCVHSAANVCSIGGKCIPPGTVNPENICQVCNPMQNKTQWVTQSGLACDDGDACTVADKCSQGMCKGTAMDCSAKSGQCATGQCQNGACFAAAKVGACDDGDQCTSFDACIGGLCKGTDKDCSVFNDKCSIGVCQAGQCKQQPKLGSCDDGDPCTVGDSCAGGGCQGKPMDCSGLDSACSQGLCNGGKCLGKPINGGMMCNDGNSCTSGDTCQSGMCTGTSKNCGYLDNTCQSGACQDGTCFAQPKFGGCNDGDACTVNDACNNGQCLGAAMNCGQFTNACGVSVCSGGQCTKPSGGECSPGQVETQKQACGNCGNQSRSRSCTNGCTWGSWSSYGSCSGQGVCSAGQTQSETQGCGNCGTYSHSRTCSNSCQWGSYGSFGACGGQGACAAGSVGACSDPCDQKVCSSSCTWGGCAKKPSAVCQWKSGTNYKCCGTLKWQFCSQSCSWFPCQYEPQSYCP